MGKEINQYTKLRTAALIKDDDLLDFDSTEDAGSTYESARMTWAELKIAVQAAVSAVNLYNTNGALTGNRAVDLATNTLAFTGGDTGFGVAPTLGRVHVKSASGVNGLYVEDNLAALRLALSDEGLLDLRSVSAHSTVVGQSAGSAAMTGTDNTIFGYAAGSSITSGVDNVFMGVGAGNQITTENYNVFIGYTAGGGTTSGENTQIGYRAGAGSVAGEKNVMLGFRAGHINQGSFNTLIGYETGFTGNGDSNVFLGYQAGYNETGSDLLYIANSNTATPLIWGDFANTLLDINGYLSLNSIKSGVDQAGAGAAANEIWKTASHATLPDNVLLIGV